MNKCLASTVLLAVFVAAPTVRVESRQVVLTLEKDAVYTVKVPACLLKPAGHRRLLSLMRVMRVEVGGSPSQLLVAGKQDWRVAGYPAMLRVAFFKKSTEPEFVDLEFRALDNSDPCDVTFRFPRDLDYKTVLGDLLLSGVPNTPTARAYLTETYRALADRFFVGALASVPPSQRMHVVEYLHLVAHGITLNSTTYKNNTYLDVDLGLHQEEYNDLKFTESTRLAEVLNRTLLAQLKVFAEPLRSIPQVFGLRVEYRIGHRDFLARFSTTEFDDLVIYAPSSVLLRFAEADITSQEFVDGCVALLNDNRVKVQLTGPP